MARILQAKSGKNNVSAGHLLLAQTEKVLVSDREFARMPSTYATTLDDLGPGILLTAPIALNTITDDEQTFATITPGFSGRIVSVFGIVTTVASTADKTAEIGVYVDEDPGVNQAYSLVTAGGAPAGGTFTLTVADQTTGNIAYDASAATVKTAIENLSNVLPGDVTTSGGALHTNPVVITFVGSLAGRPVVVTRDQALLTGGTTCTLTETAHGSTGATSAVAAVTSGGRLSLTTAKLDTAGKVIVGSRLTPNASASAGQAKFGKNSKLYFRTTENPTDFVEGAMIFGVEVAPRIKEGPVAY